MPPSKAVSNAIRSAGPSQEIRIAPSPELRATVAASGRQLIGYGATFGSIAKLPGFNETIRSGAFKRSLSNGDAVAFLWNHNSDKVLGSTQSGTLRLTEDAKGLRFVCDLPDTEEAKGYHESVRRGDVDQPEFLYHGE